MYNNINVNVIKMLNCFFEKHVIKMLNDFFFRNMNVVMIKILFIRYMKYELK